MMYRIHATQRMDPCRPVGLSPLITVISLMIASSSKWRSNYHGTPICTREVSESFSHFPSHNGCGEMQLICPKMRQRRW